MRHLNASVLVAVAIFLLVATASAASNKKKKEPTCEGAEVIECTGHVQPSADGVYGAADCGSFRFTLSNVVNAVECMQKVLRWTGDGDCPPDEVKEEWFEEIVPAIDWEARINGETTAGHGATAILPRGENLSAECTFVVSAVMPVCGLVMSNSYDAVAGIGCSVELAGEPAWIGIDRTGDPAEPYGSLPYGASASVDPPWECVENAGWGYDSVCEQQNIDDWSISLWTTNREAVSAAYQGEIVTSEALGTVATNRFTVVKVDVTINGLDEKDEHEAGAFLKYLPDATNDVISVEGTNNMVSVSFSCEPCDLPDGEVVKISCSGPAELYEQLQDGTLVKVIEASYLVSGLTNRTFKLHGHDKSTVFKDGCLQIIHEPSEAIDEAYYTCFKRPKLVPDYNRDGTIDSDDEGVYDAGNRVFRFWINDDNDTGDTNDSANDRPASGINGQDDHVNGRCDLLDFTPVMIDLSEIIPSGMPESLRTNIEWKLESDAVNAVWTSLAPELAGSFQITSCGAAFGLNLDQNSSDAMAVSLATPYVLPKYFVEVMTNYDGKGVVMIEGRSSGTSFNVKGYLGKDRILFTDGEMKLDVQSVENMYRYVSLRGAHNNPDFEVEIPDNPSNMQDNVKDVDVFFTHGFNVAELEAHAWGAEVFKRLWQSGSNARFWMFTWSGDYNWLGDAFNGLHYQQDVYQALKTGAALKAFMESAQPASSKRVLMSQSLGNMVACEALRQGLSVGKYFMFNAAVASEAIDGTLQNANSTIKAKYVPSDWSDYDSRSWAANWYKWFNDDATDSRGRMGWPDYFSSALTRAGTVYNYYSTGDPIFLESDAVPGITTGLFHWPTLSLSWPFIDFNITAEEGSWQKQETHKGVEPIAGTLRGGWGFNCWYETVGGEPVQMYYTAAQANAMVENGSITNSPVFSYGGTPLNNRNASQDDIWLSLAKYVPAISSPVGGIAPLDANNINLNDATIVTRPNGWGRDHSVYEESWLHSDMKDMAYFYVHKLYEQLVTRGGLQ